jgi:hypothetical protein
VQNGLTYNRYFLKASQYFLMSGPSVSGWKLSLLLPATDGSSYALSPLFAGWAALTLALLAAPLWLPYARRLVAVNARGRSRLLEWTAVTATTVILLAVIGSAIGALTGTTLDPHYLPDPSAVRDDLLTPFLEGQPRLTFSADSERLRRTDMTTIFPSASDARITVRPSAIEGIVDTPLTILIGASNLQREIAWGIAVIDFGDGSEPERTSLIGRVPVTHTYRSSGDFAVTIDLAAPSSMHLRGTVSAHVVGRQTIGGLEGLRFTSDVMLERAR